MKIIKLKNEISAKELVSKIWERKTFANTLLINSAGNEEAQFQARIIMNEIDFVLQKIVELQSK